MKFVKDEEVIKKYEGATAIYLLTRTKKMNKAEMILDGVALFTPLGGIVNVADTVADLGTYFLVENNNEEILVRVQGEEITEEIITGKYEVAGKRIIYGSNYFKKVKNICKK